MLLLLLLLLLLPSAVCVLPSACLPRPESSPSVRVPTSNVLQGGFLTGKYSRDEEAPADSRAVTKPEWADGNANIDDLCKHHGIAASFRLNL